MKDVILWMIATATLLVAFVFMGKYATERVVQKPSEQVKEEVPIKSTWETSWESSRN